MSLRSNKLHFSSFSFRYDGKRLIVTPVFVCPLCENDKYTVGSDVFECKFEHLFDVNNRIVYRLKCGHEVGFYVAVHKDIRSSEIHLACSVVPFLMGWWLNG